MFDEFNEAGSPEDVPVDPFDPASFREFVRDDDIAVEKVLLSLAVQKPPKQQYFRVNPDPIYINDIPVLEYPKDDFYLVIPQLVDLLAKEVSTRRLYTCVSRRGVHFLWPAKLPKGNGGKDSWSQSALDIAEHAMKSWVRMEANMDAQRYEVNIARGDLEEPRWLDKKFRDLMELGFRDRLINSSSHPVVQELFGLI